MNTRKLLVAMSVACLSAAASAQGAPDPRPGATTPVQVMNGSGNPVPVSGTVAIANTGSSPIPVTGSVSVVTSTSSPLIVEGVAETLASDKTVDVLRELLTATTMVFANHRISVDTSAYKTVRISARRSSCSGCAPVALRIASGYYGATMDLVTFPFQSGSQADELGYSRSFDVPGTSIYIEVRNTTNTGFDQTNAVAIEVAGRAN